MTRLCRNRGGLLSLFLAATATALEPSTGPPCALVGESNCQLPADSVDPGWGTGHLSDLTVPPNGVVSADDFVPQASTLTQVCVWGFYHDATVDGPDLTALDCIDAVEDEFRIRVFTDDNGLPGALLGETLVTGTNIQRGPVQDTGFANMFSGSTNAIPQGYTLTLDAPITGMVPGQRHWLEVTNNTRGPTDADRTCWWSWLQHFPQVGDGYSATGANSGGVDDPAIYLPADSRYIHGSARMSDLAFCLGTTDGPLAFDTGPPITAACWTCGDGEPPACTVETALDCVSRIGVGGIWNRLDPDCSGTLEDAGELILGDTCADPVDGARVITNGLYAMNTNCADSDGADSVTLGIDIPFSVGHDMWFHYTATCTGRMVVNACPTQPGLTQNGFDLSDGLLALYHDPDNPGECICPGPSSQFQLLPVGDESCNGIGDAGAGILQRIVFAGECYTILMTNWGNTPASTASGPAMFDVDCRPASCATSLAPVAVQVPDESGNPVMSTMNRFLAFRTTEPNRTQSVHVKFVDLPPPYDVWNGKGLWVGPPVEVPVRGGLPDPLSEGSTFTVATLECDRRFFTNWYDRGTIRLFHEGIVPGGTYKVSVNDVTCSGTTEYLSAPVELRTAVFGDTVGGCSGPLCFPPDGTVDIADALAIIGSFASVPGSIILPLADLEPACVDFKINISDALRSLSGFLGLPYPYGPSTVDPCDAVCALP